MTQTKFSGAPAIDVEGILASCAEHIAKVNKGEKGLLVDPGVPMSDNAPWPSDAPPSPAEALNVIEKFSKNKKNDNPISPL